MPARSVWWLCRTLFFLLAGATPAAAAPTAFVDVNLIAMDSDAVRPHLTVLVADGKILRVGPAASTPIPRGTTVIDGRGRFLLPGLADMHAHFLRPPTPGKREDLVFPDYLEHNRLFGLLEIANGVTTVRVLWGHPEIDRLAERFASGASIGPAIYSSGPITDGDPPVWRGARIVTTAAQARAAVGEDKAAGRAGIKLYDHLSLPAYRAIVVEARRQDLPVFGHIPFAVPLDEVIRARQNSIEHAESFLDDLQPDPAAAPKLSLVELYAHADVARLSNYAPAMRASGIWVCPTVVIAQMDWKPSHIEPAMAYIPAALSGRYAQYWNGKFPDADAEIRYGVQVVNILHRAGVGLLAGSDALKRNVVPGFALLEELQYFVRAGLTPYEAIRAATADPARFLHRQAEFGTVAPGRRADLLLLEANPLRDIANLKRRSGVMVRGRWFAQAELHARLAAVRSGPAAAPPRQRNR